MKSKSVTTLQSTNVAESCDLFICFLTFVTTPLYQLHKTEFLREVTKFQNIYFLLLQNV